MNTSLFDYDSGFRPPSEFFLKPYVLGFCVSLLNLFRAFMFKGQNWPQRKSGEFMMSAFEEIQRDSIPNDMRTLTDGMLAGHGNSEFEQGASDAELYFGAMFGMLKQSNNEPVVTQAREMAASYQSISEELGQGTPDPDAGFKLAIVELTTKQQLQSLYPPNSLS